MSSDGPDDRRDHRVPPTTFGAVPDGSRSPLPNTLGVGANDATDFAADFATDHTLASSPPSPATPTTTISGTEETILPASQPPLATSPPSTPPVDEAAGVDDYGALVVVDPRHYILGNEVARGGMGRILRARDRRLGRGVAIKELLVRDDSLAARFEREARITARLQHPAIVALHEAGRWPTGEPFFAMKLVSGKPLDKVIAGTRTLPARLGLLANVIAVVDALAYAHSEGVVHRDLKPANVLVGDYGETVVIDWGLAKTLDEPDVSLRAAAKSPTSSSAGDTVAGSVIGTPAYMPPEQAAGEPVDARADVYALGALLYHVLVGRPPYEAKTVETMLAKVLGGPPPPMQDIEKDVPIDLVAIVEKAMARDPDGRFPTAAEMAEELKRFQTGQLVTSHRYTTWQLFARWVRKHRAVVAVSVLAIVVLAVLGAFSVSRIVAARDRADQQAIEALAAQQRAEQRTNQIRIAQATDALEIDPTISLAMLAHVKVNGDESVLVDMHRIASDARSRGVAHLLRGNGRMHALAISSDGKWIAAGGVDREVHLWNVATRTQRELAGHGAPILDVVIAGDDVLSVDARGAVIRWPISNPTAASLRAAGGDILDAALSPTGQLLVTQARGKTELVELATGKVTEREEYELVAWAPDGKSIALYSQIDHEIDLLEVATGKIATTKFADLVTSIATDGRRILVGTEDNSIKDLVSDVMVDARTKHGGLVTTLALLADGTIVSSSSDLEWEKRHHEVERKFQSGDYTIALWPYDPHAATRLRGHQGNIDAVAATQNGRFVASAGRDGTIRVWTLPTISRRSGHAQLDMAVLTGDRKQLAVINSGSELDVHDVGSDKFRTLTVTDFPAGVAAEDDQVHQVTALSVADGGNRFATLDAGKQAVVWDLATDRARLLADDIAALAITPDGQRVITADRHGAVVDRDAATGADKPVAPATKPITAVAVSRTGTIAVAYEGGEVELLAPARRMLATTGGDTLKTLVWSPDGTTLVGGGTKQQLRAWTASSGELRSWPGHDEAITRIVFAPDGTHVASASLDGVARVWRLADGRSTRLRGHAGTIATMQFRSDGKALVTAGDDHTVRLWDLPGGGHRVVARHGDYVVFASFLEGERHILSVDHADEIVEVPDDLPVDEPGLREWLDSATNETVPP